MALDIRLIRVMDEATIDVDGQIKRVKRADFRIGTFGPFTERVELGDNALDQIMDRARALRTQLERHTA